MSLNGVCYECPICKSQGKKSLVRPLQISINDALIGCEDPECWYPFGVDSKSLLVKSSYKTLEANKFSQVTHTASLKCDDSGNSHSISTNICNDSILDEFQLDALLQDCSVQLDDDFCQDFNSFLNCDNQESVQTNVTSFTRSQEQNDTGVLNVISDNAMWLHKDLDWDKGKEAELLPPSTVSVVEDVLVTQKNIARVENQTNEIFADSVGMLEFENSLNSRDISERFVDNVKKQGNYGLGISKSSKSLLGKKPVSPPSKAGLVDAMKYIDSGACDIALQTAKSEKKTKHSNYIRKKVVVKPGLDFLLG